jgi:hypothetical protein
LRIDQVMKVCLKYCTPIAAAMFLGAVCWTYCFPGGIGLRSMPYAQRFEETAKNAGVTPSSKAAASATASKQIPHYAGLDIATPTDSDH